MNKAIKGAIPWIVSIALVIAIIAIVDVQKVAEDVAGYGIAGFLLLCGIFTLNLIARGVRWKFLAKPAAEISTAESTHIVAVSFMVNNILPLRVGELARAYLLAKLKGAGKAKSLSTVIVERVLDGITLLGIFAAGILLVPEMPAEIGSVVLLPLAFFAVLFIVFLFPARFLPLIRGILGRTPYIGARLHGLAEDLMHGGLALRQGARSAAIVSISSLLVWLGIALMYWLVLSHFGVNMGIGGIFVLTGITSLGVMLPSAPAYIGTHEALVGFVFLAFGLDMNTAITVAVIVHIVTFVVPLVFGIISLNSLGMSWGELARIRGRE
ncbi:MAG: lysylphosphatidylglycerol synthase transmembrane domain-containing protein [Candidatus Diapherotrites archaeon]